MRFGRSNDDPDAMARERAAGASPTSPPMASENQRLNQIFEAEFDFVWRTVRRLGVKERELDDAVQQVFVVLSRRLDAVDPGRERSFLFGTARRVASDYRRRYRSSREDLVDDEPVPRGQSPYDPAVLVDRKRARAMLQDVLDEMPDEMREVFCLYELEGMTTSEVADTMQVSTGTVASRLRRARELFQRATRRLSARLQFEGKDG